MLGTALFSMATELSAFTFSKRPKEEVGRLLIVTAESSIRIFRMDMLPFEESHAFASQTCVHAIWTRIFYSG